LPAVPVAPVVPKSGVKIEETPTPPEKAGDKDKEKVKEKEKDKEKKKLDLDLDEVLNDIGGWATVVVHVPADAKVFIDGKQMASKSTRRVFQTPALEAGQKYYYEIRAEVVRDGRTITQTRQVILNAGLSTAAAFADLGDREPAATAQNDKE